MKPTRHPISPFIILLIPALLVVGYKSTGTTEIEPEKQQASIKFQIPSLKGMVKAIF